MYTPANTAYIDTYPKYCVFDPVAVVNPTNPSHVDVIRAFESAVVFNAGNPATRAYEKYVPAAFAVAAALYHTFGVP